MFASKMIGGSAAALLLGFVASSSFAASPVAVESAQAATPFDSAAAASAPLAGQTESQSLSSEELGALSGGDGGVALAVSTQNASNTGNQINANSVVTGGINVSQDAFSSFSGLGNIIMNTGNNNNIQSSMSVSISMPAK